MSSGNDDFELDEEELDAGAQELERHGDAIYSSIKDYIAEHDLPEDVVSGMLLVMAIQLRMVGYAFDTEQPSATGLKLDLDRFRNEMEEAVRAAKKDAEEFIAEVKRMPEELEDDLEDDDDDDDEDEEEEEDEDEEDDEDEDDDEDDKKKKDKS